MSYKDLKSYQQATIIYDFTAEFCERYVIPSDRTYKSDESYRSDKTYQSNRSYRTADQMLQAARSGKQNIVEGSSQKTSEKSELKLLGVSRASFQELLEDFEDFLRQRNLKQWSKDDPQAAEIRALAYKTNKSYKTYRSYLDDPESAANCAICLIHQVNFLLDRQIKSLENEFIKQGGYTENLRRQRENEKKKKLARTYWTD